MAECCDHIEALNKKANCSKHKESEDNVLAAAPEKKIKLYMNHVDVNALNNLQLCDLQFSKYQKLEKDIGRPECHPDPTRTQQDKTRRG